MNFTECQDYTMDSKVKLINYKPNVFKVYKANKKPFFDFETKYHILSFITIGTFFYLEYYLKIELLVSWKILLITYGISFIISGIYNINRIEKLNAKYLGEIIINKSEIKTPNQEYKLSEIHKIKFNNYDYYGGSRILFDESDFHPRRSNGINNKITIELINKKVKSYNFFQQTADDLLKNRDILIHYFMENKMDFLNLKETLHLVDKRDITKLKKELKIK